MGTNYYLMRGACSECQRADETLHLGKSSAGWHFAIHVIPEKRLNCLAEWQKLFFLKYSVIVDEYDNTIKPEVMLDIIKNRRNPKPPTAEWCKENHAEIGLNNLAMVPSARHGAGTWDYCEGGFG